MEIEVQITNNSESNDIKESTPENEDILKKKKALNIEREKEIKKIFAQEKRPKQKNQTKDDTESEEELNTKNNNISSDKSHSPKKITENDQKAKVLNYSKTNKPFNVIANKDQSNRSATLLNPSHKGNQENHLAQTKTIEIKSFIKGSLLV